MGRDYFIEKDGVAAVPAHYVRGQGRFMVVLGENASGKSFFRRVLSSVAKRMLDTSVEMIPLSMEGRRSQYMSSLVYGNEQEESTGENSVRMVLTGIKTCQGRINPHVIFWDEPDIGLSDSWTAGLGVAFRDFALALPEHTLGAFVVTHRRALVQELLPANPHFLYLGEDDVPATLADWLQRPIKPRNINDLLERSRSRWRRIDKILSTKV